MSFQIVVIGASAGGLHALEALLGTLPATFPLPIAVVLHRSADSGAMLCAALRRSTLLPVLEPQDKEAIRAGHVYIAPPDYHLLVERGHFELSTEAPVRFARPSIDLLFETAADAYAEGVIGVVLTGANSDGAAGAARIRALGGAVLVQEPESAESPAMPRAALASMTCERALPLPEIASALIEICTARRG